MKEPGQDGATGAPEAPSWSLWRIVPVAILGIGTATVFATGSHRYLSLGQFVAYRNDLQAWVDGNHAVAALVLGGVYVAVVALSVPGSVFLTILCGFLFGWIAGGALAVVCASIGAIIVFLIARTSFGDVLFRLARGRLQSLAEGFRRDAFSYLLFLRFLPIVPFWLTNLASALFGVGFRTFALATFIGIIPATFTFATAGAGLDSLLDSQRAARDACVAAGGTDCSFDLGIRALLTPQILAAFAGLGVLSLIPIVVRRRAQARADKAQADKAPADKARGGAA